MNSYDRWFLGLYLGVSTLCLGVAMMFYCKVFGMCL
jgi:hypothetical protein